MNSGPITYRYAKALQQLGQLDLFFERQRKATLLHGYITNMDLLHVPNPPEK